MEDTKAASLVMIAGAVGVGYWYWSLKHGVLSAPAAASKAPPGSSTLAALQAFADKYGLRFETGGTGQDYTLLPQPGVVYNPTIIARQAQSSHLPASVVGGQVHVGLAY